MEPASCFTLDPARGRLSLLATCLPDGVRADDLGILNYPAFTVMGFYQDYLVHGDASFIKMHLDRVRDILYLYHRLANEEGFITTANARRAAGSIASGWNFFIDWANPEALGPAATGAPTYAQMLIMRAFMLGAYFEELAGDAAHAAVYREAGCKLNRAITSRLWDASARAFYNGLDEKGQVDRRFMAPAQYLGILFDLVPPQAYTGLFERVLLNPACRSANTSLAWTWDFQAFARAGRMEPGLDHLRRAWGRQVTRGATRFAEDYWPDESPERNLAMFGRPYGNSLIHMAGGAAPLVALSRGVLGVTPTGPGYKTCRIAPDLGGLAWAKGEIPTHNGPIRVELEDGKPARITLPAQVTARLGGSLGQSETQALTGPGLFSVASG